jgi:hypothetical protein
MDLSPFESLSVRLIFFYETQSNRMHFETKYIGYYFPQSTAFFLKLVQKIVGISYSLFITHYFKGQVKLYLN